MASAVASRGGMQTLQSSQEYGVSTDERTYVSRVTLRLKHANAHMHQHSNNSHSGTSTGANTSGAGSKQYEWRTEVLTPPAMPVKEPEQVAQKQEATNAAAAPSDGGRSKNLYTPATYHPPEEQSLALTLTDFMAAERYHSEYNQLMAGIKGRVANANGSNTGKAVKGQKKGK